MKKISKLALILLAIVILTSSTVFATAEPTVEGETTTAPTAESTPTEETDTGLGEGDVVNADKFIAGENLEITEIVDGNIFIIGKNVTINQTLVNGNVFIIAENLTMDIETEIYGSLYAIAKDMNVNSRMYDTYLVADKFNFGYEAIVQRDLRVMASEITLDGRVYRNAFVEADKLTLSDFLMIGDLNYIAQSEAKYIKKNEDGTTEPETTEIPTGEEGIIRGEVKYTQRKKKLFDKTIAKTVEEILKSNKIDNNTSEEKIKSIIMAYIFNGMGVSSNTQITKGNSESVMIPKVYIYITAVVIILLVLALILPIILKKTKNGEPRLKKEKKSEENRL